MIKYISQKFKNFKDLEFRWTRRERNWCTGHRVGSSMRTTDHSSTSWRRTTESQGDQRSVPERLFVRACLSARALFSLETSSLGACHNVRALFSFETSSLVACLNVRVLFSFETSSLRVCLNVSALFSFKTMLRLAWCFWTWPQIGRQFASWEKIVTKLQTYFCTYLILVPFSHYFKYFKWSIIFGDFKKYIPILGDFVNSLVLPPHIWTKLFYIGYKNFNQSE
jgi:hypothetical protein